MKWTQPSGNRTKSKIRARVEHLFAVVQRQFGHIKVRYRGLTKNANRSFVALGWRTCTWRVPD